MELSALTGNPQSLGTHQLPSMFSNPRACSAPVRWDSASDLPVSLWICGLSLLSLTEEEFLSKLVTYQVGVATPKLLHASLEAGSPILLDSDVK